MARIGSKCSACLSMRRGQQRHAEADIEHARGVLRPLHVARHPEQILGGAAQHHQRSSTQVSLVPPPWLELTTSEPFAQRHAREAAGDHARLLAGEHEGPEIDVARHDLAVDQRRRGGQRQRRLGDVVVGVRA